MQAVRQRNTSSDRAVQAAEENTEEFQVKLNETIDKLKVSVPAWCILAAGCQTPLPAQSRRCEAKLRLLSSGMPCRCLLVLASARTSSCPILHTWVLFVFDVKASDAILKLSELRSVPVGAWLTSQGCLPLKLIMLATHACRPSGTRQTRSQQSLALESPPL